jgi:hypothetical protein
MRPLSCISWFLLSSSREQLLRPGTTIANSSFSYSFCFALSLELARHEGINCQLAPSIPASSSFCQSLSIAPPHPLLLLAIILPLIILPILSIAPRPPLVLLAIILPLIILPILFPIIVAIPLFRNYSAPHHSAYLKEPVRSSMLYRSMVLRCSHFMLKHQSATGPGAPVRAGVAPHVPLGL